MEYTKNLIIIRYLSHIYGWVVPNNIMYSTFTIAMFTTNSRFNPIVNNTHRIKQQGRISCTFAENYLITYQLCHLQ